MPPLPADWWLRYVGAPYLFRGRSLETGIDCWGLVRLVLGEAFGVCVDDFGLRYAGPNGRKAARDAIAAELPGWHPVAWEEGAVALLREGGIPCHVGVCTATEGVILHAHASCGVNLLDIPRSLYWKDRLVGCFLPH